MKIKTLNNRIKNIQTDHLSDEAKDVIYNIINNLDGFYISHSINGRCSVDSFNCNPLFAEYNDLLNVFNSLGLKLKASISNKGFCIQFKEKIN